MFKCESSPHILSSMSLLFSFAILESSAITLYLLLFLLFFSLYLCFLFPFSCFYTSSHRFRYYFFPLILSSHLLYLSSFSVIPFTLLFISWFLLLIKFIISPVLSSLYFLPSFLSFLTRTFATVCFSSPFSLSSPLLNTCMYCCPAFLLPPPAFLSPPSVPPSLFVALSPKYLYTFWCPGV